MTQKINTLEFEYRLRSFVAERSHEDSRIDIHMDRSVHRYGTASLARLVTLGTYSEAEARKLRKKVRAWMDGKSREISVDAE
jgi:hypothetical protein